MVVDPETGAWAETGAMSTPRMNHTATLLPDGRVLVAGGSDQNRIVRTSYWFSTKEPGSSDYDEGVYNLDTLEVWDPRRGLEFSWAVAGSADRACGGIAGGWSRRARRRLRASASPAAPRQ
ncbi:MAG: hypothetical protein IPL61_36420 [Myxococcales bacterium]|nr:hypothetical protein [Myxococcales bacterium]